MLVDARGITKAYPGTRALNGVSLQVQPGEIFGLFGPNGAGKTTFLRVLAGLTRPDGGWAQVAGIDVLEHPNLVRRFVSILFDVPYLYAGMSFEQYLEFCGRLGGVAEGEIPGRVRDVLAGLGQQQNADQRIARLSTGERQRVELGRVLMTEAPLLFLDEPFSNVDIELRMRLRAHLRGWLAGGRSIVYTSHNLLESEHFVDRFAFIYRGRILAVGTARDLKEQLLVPVFLLQVSNVAAALEALKPLAPQFLRVTGPDTVELAVARRDDVPLIARALIRANVDLLEMRSAATLEHVYQRLIPAGPGGGR